MHPSKQEIIDSFNRECPPAIRDDYSDEGLKLLLDFVEQYVKQDEKNGYEFFEFEVTSKILYDNYCEQTCVEFIESFELEPGINECQNEAEKQAAMESVITEYLKTRGFLVGFTSTGRVVCDREVSKPEPQEDEMYEFD